MTLLCKWVDIMSYQSGPDILPNLWVCLMLPLCQPYVGLTLFQVDHLSGWCFVSRPTIELLFFNLIHCSPLPIYFKATLALDQSHLNGRLLHAVSLALLCAEKLAFKLWETRIAWFKSNWLLNIQMYNMSSLHKYIKTI